MVNRKSFKLAAALAASTWIATTPVAQAADLTAPDVLPDTYDWSGAYVGGMIAGVFIYSDYIPPGAPDPELDGDGIVGGVYAGYNLQSGRFVFGIEADAMFGEVNPENTLGLVEQDVDFIATVRGRVGIAHDRTLAYATGGIAFADSEITLLALGESDSNTHVGFAVGGGLEHAWRDHFLGRIEYLYASFDDQSYGFTPGPLVTGLDDVHMVRIGAAWKF